MNIELPLTGYDGRIRRTVEAEIVDVAPHAPLATWAVHLTKWGDQWTVTNIETGCDWRDFVGETKAESIANARKYLATKTDEQIMEAISKIKCVLT